MSVLANCALLAPHTLPGKQGIKGEHRKLIKETAARKVFQSVDFELAAEMQMKKLRRWDYFIEVQPNATTMHAVEVHEFDRSALKAKKEGTLTILRATCPASADSIKSWNVIVRGALPRQDVLARFKADSRISLGRDLSISKL